MKDAGIKIEGTLIQLLENADIIVDCTPKKIAAQNITQYRKLNKKFIVQGGEKHATTGHSFSAENNYETALGLDSTRVVSCNTTSIIRTLTALKNAGLLKKARGTLLRRATDPLGKPPGWNYEYIVARKRYIESPGAGCLKC